MYPDAIELSINQYHGLNTREAKSLLLPGFSRSMHDIDLSSPGVVKTRGGSAELTITGIETSGSSINSLYTHLIPSSNSRVMFFNYGTKLSQTDENGSATLIASGFTNNEIFDFVSYGDLSYAGNGEDDNIVISGTDTRIWGIAAPTSPPTVAVGAAGVLSGDYLYKYAYVNSSNSHISNGSSSSATVSPSSQKVDLSNIGTSSDPQVDKIYIYRTTAGGSTFLFVAEINNGTTAYTDNTADADLGTTQAPTDNNTPPVNFLYMEEWDGVIWGVGKNSTVLYRTNTEFETVTGEGLPEESFGTFNFIDYRTLIYGIRKSPTQGELWVHTDKGVYAVLNTGTIQDPYATTIRNQAWHSISHKSIVNIDSRQWAIGEQGKVFSLDEAGNPNYESYLIEPTISDEGNIAVYTKSVCVNYSTGQKNQYRCICAETGQSTPNRMFAANYRQRVPVSYEGFVFPVWEFHKISATAMTTFKNSSGNSLLYTGTSDGKIIRHDIGTNDDGVAIDWSFTLGWTRTTSSAFKHCLLKNIMAWFNPQGNYSINAFTTFDFGKISGNTHELLMVQEGDLWDSGIWDTAVWGGDEPLQLIVMDESGDYKYLEVTYSGNGLNEIFNMQMMSLFFTPIEGIRKK